MENKEITQSRDGNDSSSGEKRTEVSTGGDTGSSGKPDNKNTGTDGSPITGTEGSDEAINPHEIPPLENEDLGIPAEFQTSTIYRRAIQDYDPNEMQVQLSEHYFFTDAQYERDGHF